MYHIGQSSYLIQLGQISETSNVFGLIKRIIKHFLPSDLLNVAFDSGGHDKQTIVLLHGIAATSKTWDYLIKDLDITKYRVITIDLLGFGNSPKPIICNYSVDDHCEYLHRTIRDLNIRKPFLLVGHSMGSIIATHYYSQNKRDINGLFLLSLPLYIKYPEFKQTFLSEKQTDIFIKIYDYLSSQKDVAIKYSQKIRSFLKVYDGVEVNEENWNSFRMSLKNTVIKQDTYAEIKDSRVPVNIIYGVLDNFVVQKNVDYLAKFNNVLITKLQAVHHLVDKRFAASAAKQITDFLDSIEKN